MNPRTSSGTRACVAPQPGVAPHVSDFDPRDIDSRVEKAVRVLGELSLPCSMADYLQIGKAVTRELFAGNAGPWWIRRQRGRLFKQLVAQPSVMLGDAELACALMAHAASTVLGSPNMLTLERAHVAAVLLLDRVSVIFMLQNACEYGWTPSELAENVSRLRRLGRKKREPIVETLQTVLRLDRPEAFDGGYVIGDFQESYAREIQAPLRRLIDGLSRTFDHVSWCARGEPPRQPLLVVSRRLAEGRELCALLQTPSLPVYVATPWEALQVERRFSGALVALSLEAFSGADLAEVLLERELIPWVIFYTNDTNEDGQLLARARERAAKYGTVVSSESDGARRYESAARAVMAELELHESSK